MNIFGRAAAVSAALAQDGQPWGQSGETRGGDKELEKVFWPSVGAFLETK